MTVARSVRVRVLERRLNELRRHLLPRDFDPTGSYSAREFDRARAYRVLAHAEIESCLEDLVRDTANRLKPRAGSDIYASRVAAALLAYHPAPGLTAPDSLTSAPSRPRLRERVDESREAFIGSVVRRNHGIRERNVLRLLLPVGILESDLDPAWLQVVDAFGEARGLTAHTSQVGAQQPPDPATDFRSVQQIVAGLRRIDAKLQQLAR